eukprot:TRINITY_DN11535_c0_g1_i1.p1 TRINITY_DN11535_c0_g1~~TRINITY_DN11535_c0_g1_i1.p1  ORF type:complete len:165 (-),score=36.73 TRINITY_DN11535_c0_g1_i1:58-552(-)
MKVLALFILTLALTYSKECSMEESNACASEYSTCYEFASDLNDYDGQCACLGVYIQCFNASGCATEETYELMVNGCIESGCEKAICTDKGKDDDCDYDEVVACAEDYSNCVLAEDDFDDANICKCYGDLLRCDGYSECFSDDVMESLISVCLHDLDCGEEQCKV